MRLFLFALCVLAETPALADDVDLKAIVADHVVPRYQSLAAEAAYLRVAAARDCAPDNAQLVTAYHDAFDAWVRVSHLRFGPSEQNGRAFALAFWPDPRSATPRALSALIQNNDAAVTQPDAFSTVSIAARGIYALDYMLCDPQFSVTINRSRHCALVRAITGDIATNAAAILDGWQGGYGTEMSRPGNDRFRTTSEAERQLFTALMTGLEFTAHARLGRPLGTFDRPRPSRAEAWRSGRSLRHVILSLQATAHLANLISGSDPQLTAALATAIARAEVLNDPIFAGVSDPQTRLRIEVLQQNVNAIRLHLTQRVGPSLGIAAGFNALDGD
ncbi:imelysin family protein [uncultured Tateyamaria sp.]|uniref:imelysin family protein n=1 Tax=uncultured Tateyamaria sp. TaxID=455651 RepID=UPI002638813E|nr:imelysin family protein [uncultured Tateyamaria sp.]